MELPWQALENPQLREQLGMGERSGVLIRGVLPLSECARRDLVQRDDILLAIDGQPIADDGTFAVGQQERLSFQHLIHLKFDGQAVRLRLLRGGDELTVDVPVHPQHRLVPTTTYDVPQVGNPPSLTSPTLLAPVAGRAPAPNPNAPRARTACRSPTFSTAASSSCRSPSRT